ncbi:MAG: hypothetical protein IPL42_16315 [Saprospiraceae bacterium]|nr:hypothetical protein [Saprospiraceae bacterium]
MSVNFVNAQKVYAWMDAGIKVGYGLTGMVNSNLFDDKNYEHHLTTGTSIGAKLGLYIGLYNGITVDFMLSSNNQKFDFFKNNKSYIHDINWKIMILQYCTECKKMAFMLNLVHNFLF